MEASILNTIKQMLGLGIEESPFDPELIVHINSGIALLNQLGVGEDGYYIDSNRGTWYEFIPDIDYFSHVKQYLYLYVRTIWDPPSSSSVLSVFQETMKKLEFYIMSRSREVL